MAITVEDAQSLARPDSVKKSKSALPSAEDLGDRFLTLLVTQMRNQDPLNPVQNAEVTSQLAQISTVTGVDKLNTAIQDMSKTILGSQTMQASSLVGHGVLAAGKILQLAGGGAIGGLDLKDPAKEVKVDIFNANGQLVKTLDLKDKPAGVSSFIWDGHDDNQMNLADGLYSFEVRASSDGKKVDAERLAYSPVMSVTLGGSKIVLNTQTLGALSYDQVKQIY